MPLSGVRLYARERGISKFLKEACDDMGRRFVFNFHHELMVKDLGQNYFSEAMMTIWGG